MIRVLLADDQPAVLAGLTTILEHGRDITVISAASTGDEALTLIRRHHPDVAVVDIRMPGYDGIHLAGLIVGDPGLRDVRVLVLTSYEIDDYVLDALDKGATGFLVKTADPDELRLAVRTVAAGHPYLGPGPTRTLIDAHRRRRSSPLPEPDLTVFATLTERELDVVREVGRGLTNQQIATALHLSPLTVKSHVSRAMTKLGVENRTRLALLTYETGPIRPPPAHRRASALSAP